MLRLSKIDCDRFNKRVAKFSFEDEGVAYVDQLHCEAHQLGVELLIVRVPTAEVDVVQRIESLGGILCDTLLYFQKNKVEPYRVALPSGYSLSLATTEDAQAVGDLGAQTFKGYFGHYHADSRLSKVDADAVYESWARNSCRERDLADDVILIKSARELAAFATLKRLNQSTFEGVLFGVSPNHRNRGLHFCLMQASQNWGCDNGLQCMRTSTQVNNHAVQKNWCRAGLEPVSSYYTMHVWMSNDTVQ